jgi:hypothetical protein
MGRLYKALGTAANLLMVYLTWRWFRDGLNLNFGLGCLILSGYAIVVTRAQLGHLFATYFNIMSRLQVLIPLGWGVLFAALALAEASDVWVRVAAAAVLIWWASIYYRYCSNKKQYFKQGHGPLPMGAWVNPPIDALEPGDILLTSGCVAERSRQSVGHAEQVILVNGQKKLISSWMGKGAVLNAMERVVKPGEHHWVALRPVVPWTADQNRLAELLSLSMLRENAQYIEKTRAKRDRILGNLVMPNSLRERLRNYFSITGYDWVGLYSGRRACDNWTCVGMVMELWWRMGLRMRWLGTGLLGLGTGLLDPLKADRLLDEPALRLLTAADKAEFDRAATVRGAAVAAG